MDDHWFWKLHSSQRYTVGSAYANLTEGEDNVILTNTHVLCLKQVPLKINIFAWRLYFNRIPTKDNLDLRHIIDINDQDCSICCGSIKDRDHLVVKCDFYGRIWPLDISWLDFSTTTQIIT